MSDLNNYYEDPFNENPFSNHFSSSLSNDSKKNIKFNDKLLNNRIDFNTNNTSILENNDNGIVNSISKNVISKSLKNNKSLAKKYSRDNYCCATHCAFTLDKNKIPIIIISDALKITDMSGSSFIVYVIRTTEPENNSTLLEVRRRYSEFASLRNLLHQYYPSLIIPPIPEKHSLTEYAIKQGKAKENPKIIEKRKRMLQVFLNRLGKHPVFASLHIFHVFLEPGNWLEYEHKMAKVTIPISITSFDVSEELQYKEIKKYAKDFMKCISILLKAHHSLISIYQNLSHSYSSLGASYNGWSLHEIGLSPVLESVGQSSDSNRLALCRMTSLLNIAIIESLQEYNAFSKIILNIIAWYKNNYRQYYYICNSLSKKQTKLEILRKAEEKAKKKEKNELKKEKNNIENKDDSNISISDDGNTNDEEKDFQKDNNLLHDSKFDELRNSTPYPYPETIPTSSVFDNDLSNSIFENNNNNNENNNNNNSNTNNNNDDEENNNDLKNKSIFESLDQNEINPKMDDDDIFDDINKPSVKSPLSQDVNIFSNDIYKEPISSSNDVSSSTAIATTTATGKIDTIKKINKNFIKGSRKSEIENVKESISRLQQLKESQYKEIIKTGKEIQYDFTYFQREKYSDFKQIFIHYAKINREYNEQMIKVWNNTMKIWNDIRV